MKIAVRKKGEWLYVTEITEPVEALAIEEVCEPRAPNVWYWCVPAGGIASSGCVVDLVAAKRAADLECTLIARKHSTINLSIKEIFLRAIKLSSPKEERTSRRKGCSSSITTNPRKPKAAKGVTARST